LVTALGSFRAEFEILMEEVALLPLDTKGAGKAFSC